MSLDRFAPAEAAFKNGEAENGIRLTEEQLEQNPAAPVAVYRNFAALLFRRKAFAQAERWASAGVALFPKDYELWNVLGVAQRRQQKYESAIKSLRQAEKIDPKNTSAISNRANIYNDLKNGPAAVELFTKLVRVQPNSPDFQRGLGRAYWYSGDLDRAATRMNLAIKAKADHIDAWLDLAAIKAEASSHEDALLVIDQAMTIAPNEVRLAEARAVALRRSGRLRETEAYLIQLRQTYENEPWLHYQLGGVISDYDRERGNEHFEKAIALSPDNAQYRMALIESLARSRYGDESDHLERSLVLLKQAMEIDPELSATTLKIASEVLVRTADFDAADSLGSFSHVGRTWVEAGKHTALLGHLARVRTPEDRLELVEMHRIWGRKVAKGVKRWPIKKPAPRPPAAKIRLGFMSSDLRNHPVAYFAMPLFEHLDRSRFEVYCYSFYEGAKADVTQARITELVDAFRWKQDIAERDVAQMIADDQLDMLIELGGSTHMNKLSVMGFKAAPLQASWLGYPHSAGLETIDYLILDPFVAPASADLLVEKPLLMPKSWIAMGERAFPDRPITPGTPEARNGFLTFGTANNPYKYSREMVQTWAKVTASVPDARFIFVRPEGGAPSFQKNILAIFANEGVAAERVRFEDVRGAHMPFYNEIDISLDTFPQTGGTTTCESLWMGVPVVTLIGDAMFERLSYSILSNAGLGDLCAKTPEEYVEIALRLAGDPARRETLRTELRATLKASPLGQTKAFADDFYDMIAGAVDQARAEGKLPQAAA